MENSLLKHPLVISTVVEWINFTSNLIHLNAELKFICFLLLGASEASEIRTNYFLFRTFLRQCSHFSSAESLELCDCLKGIKTVNFLFPGGSVCTANNRHFWFTEFENSSGVNGSWKPVSFPSYNLITGRITFFPFFSSKVETFVREQKWGRFVSLRRENDWIFPIEKFCCETFRDPFDLINKIVLCFTSAKGKYYVLEKFSHLWQIFQKFRVEILSIDLISRFDNATEVDGFLTQILFNNRVILIF